MTSFCDNCDQPITLNPGECTDCEIDTARYAVAAQLEGLDPADALRVLQSTIADLTPAQETEADKQARHDFGTSADLLASAAQDVATAWEQDAVPSDCGNSEWKARFPGEALPFIGSFDEWAPQLRAWADCVSAEIMPRESVAHEYGARTEAIDLDDHNHCAPCTEYLRLKTLRAMPFIVQVNETLADWGNAGRGVGMSGSELADVNDLVSEWAALEAADMRGDDS